MPVYPSVHVIPYMSVAILPLSLNFWGQSNGALGEYYFCGQGVASGVCMGLCPRGVCIYKLVHVNVVRLCCR